MQIEETYTSYDFNESRNRTRPGLIRRLMARLIDYQMIIIFFLFTDFLTDGLIMENMHWFMKKVTGVPTQPLTVMYLSLLFAGYFILFHSLGGQTPGKFIFAVRVIRQDESESDFKTESLNLARNILRELGWLLGLVLGGWPLLLVFLNRNRRGLHDWLSSSVVRGA